MGRSQTVLITQTNIPLDELCYVFTDSSCCKRPRGLVSHMENYGLFNERHPSSGPWSIKMRLLIRLSGPLVQMARMKLSSLMRPVRITLLTKSAPHRLPPSLPRLITVTGCGRLSNVMGWAQGKGHCVPDAEATTTSHTLANSWPIVSEWEGPN